MMHLAHSSDQYSENMMSGLNTMMSGIGCFSGNFNSPLGILIALFWFIFWISIVALLILLVIFLFKKFSGKSIIEKSALDILKERYAKGEISKEEFEKKKQDLEK